VVAARVAMDQLEAMGATSFDVGVKRFDGTMILREGWGAKQVLKALLWLRRENLNQGHIYIRPAGLHGLSLVDDLTAAAIQRMKAEGFASAAVVESSPGNFQAWLKHGQVLTEALSTQAAKQLAERFGGDRGIADWRHFGRLAGFTNPKPNRRLASGLQPFARLLEASGKVYRQAPVFIVEVKAALAGDDVSQAVGATIRAGQGASELSPLRALADSTLIHAMAATFIARTWLGAAMPRIWASPPAKFAPPSRKRATSPRRAVRVANASMPSALPTKPFDRQIREKFDGHFVEVRDLSLSQHGILMIPPSARRVIPKEEKGRNGFGSAVRARRKYLGLTQQQLATRIRPRKMRGQSRKRTWRILKSAIIRVPGRI
jgi:hypothetical protein